MPSTFEANSFGPDVSEGLVVRRHRAWWSLVIGAPMLAIGSWLINSKGSTVDGEIQNVWDVIGGLAAGVGLCVTVAGCFMWWTGFRWRRLALASGWTSSAVDVVPTWLLSPSGRLLVVLRDFDPDGVYSAGMSTMVARSAVMAAPTVHVAGRRGSTLVVAAGPRRLVTVRPPRTRWTRRRWSWRIDHPAEANRNPIRRVFRPADNQPH